MVILPNRGVIWKLLLCVLCVVVIYIGTYVVLLYSVVINTWIRDEASYNIIVSIKTGNYRISDAVYRIYSPLIFLHGAISRIRCSVPLDGLNIWSVINNDELNMREDLRSRSNTELSETVKTLNLVVKDHGDVSIYGRLASLGLPMVIREDQNNEIGNCVSDGPIEIFLNKEVYNVYTDTYYVRYVVRNSREINAFEISAKRNMSGLSITQIVVQQ